MEPSRRERMQGKAEGALARGAEILRDVFAEVIIERATRPKYDDAESVVLGVLDKRIDAIEAKTKPGAEQTQKDANLLKVHKEIRSEIQAALDERWHSRERSGSA
ncbi:hypothetical protein ACIO3S_17355 [Nocardioides sp. NPDC087217]|uniref:hypothetical protein n=1 Tax=Nocardioides sp. NPDC087217 TaxID=3364335 RepID=UPI0038162F3B